MVHTDISNKKLKYSGVIRGHFKNIPFGLDLSDILFKIILEKDYYKKFSYKILISYLITVK